MTEKIKEDTIKLPSFNVKGKCNLIVRAGRGTLTSGIGCHDMFVNKFLNYRHNMEPYKFSFTNARTETPFKVREIVKHLQKICDYYRVSVNITYNNDNIINCIVPAKHPIYLSFLLKAVREAWAFNLANTGNKYYKNTIDANYPAVFNERCILANIRDVPYDYRYQMFYLTGRFSIEAMRLLEMSMLFPEFKNIRQNGIYAYCYEAYNLIQGVQNNRKKVTKK